MTGAGSGARIWMRIAAGPEIEAGGAGLCVDLELELRAGPGLGLRVGLGLGAIFSILGEELGLMGTITVLFIYLAIFTIGLIIAKKADDKFGQLLGFGLSFNIVFSAFINAGVVSGILPTTGITLPFISFGGTSIIIFAMSVGIIINIANQTAKKQELRMAQVG